MSSRDAHDEFLAEYTDLKAGVTKVAADTHAAEQLERKYLGISTTHGSKDLEAEETGEERRGAN